MSNYTKATDFASKDALLSGNPSKVIKGTEIDTEFNAIATAVSTKADLASPTFTGTPLAPTASAATNTTQIATTAFVGTAITNERTATVTLTNKTLTSPTINSPTISSPSMTNVTITSGTITGITDITVADGGTGRSTLTANNLLVGNGTSAVDFIAPGTSGNILTSNGTSWSSSAAPSPITRATAQATTSGTEFTFTGIPSTAKRITVMFNAVSHDAFGGGSSIIIRLGDAGGIETTGYTSASFNPGGNASSTAGFVLRETDSAGSIVSGIMTLVNISGNIWVSSHATTQSATQAIAGGGVKTLSDTLTQIQLTTISGLCNFDAGSINIMYE